MFLFRLRSGATKYFASLVLGCFPRYIISPHVVHGGLNSVRIVFMPEEAAVQVPAVRAAAVQAVAGQAVDIQVAAEQAADIQVVAA